MIPSEKRLCGRLVRIEALSLWVDAGQGPLWYVSACDVSYLKAGDFIQFEIETVPTRAEPIVHDVNLLARPTGTDDPFPSPQGDYFRLQKGNRRRFLSLRSRCLATIRDFFLQRDFLEIEAPLMVRSPGLELHLQGFAVTEAATDEPERYLITSPEYQMKRLLSAGLHRIFSLGKVFRSGEAGPVHHPEFTMLEWYRAFEGWEAVAQDVSAVCAQLARSIHKETFFEHPIEGKPCRVDLSLPWKTQTVRECVAQHAGIDIVGDETVAEFLHKMKQARLRIPQPSRRDSSGQDVFAWEDLFFSIFLDQVEPRLSSATEDGYVRPIVLCDWPVRLCALARKKPGNPSVVERFEAYVAGLELCNGFGELCDPKEQKERLLHDLEERKTRGLPQYPVDERFLFALREGMPPSSGVALGVDRLLMLLLGASHIREVLPFTLTEL